MASRETKLAKKRRLHSDVWQGTYHAGKFYLPDNFSDNTPQLLVRELRTAEEHAEYYEDMIQNKGRCNSRKMANHCIKMEQEIWEKVKHLDRDEAQPLLKKMDTLVDLVNQYDGDSFVSQELFSKRMRRLKKMASFWRNIHSWDPDELRARYDSCNLEEPLDWDEVLFIRAQKDPDAIEILSSRIHWPMIQLLELAEMDNENAVLEAVKVLEQYVRLLNLFAKTNLEVFKKVASQLRSWPVVYSPHPKLNQIPQSISEQIGLGAGIDFEFGRQAKWNPNDLGCKIAMRLYEHIKMMRQYPKRNASSPCIDEALRLPDITEDDSVEAWWKVAKEVLLTGYPKPEENCHLRGLTKIENRGKVRGKILERIESRFFSLFPKGARITRYRKLKSPT